MRKFLAYIFGLAGFLTLAAIICPDGGGAGTDLSSIGLGLPLAAGIIVNKATLDNVFVNIKTTFNKAFELAESTWQKTAMLVPSGSGQNDYKWLSKFPKMQKWVGEKNIKSLEAFNYTLVNDDFEATVEVDRNDIEDDNLGIYAPMAQEAGYSSKLFPDELIDDLKNKCFVNSCYDGQYFYDTDHPVGDGKGGTVSVSNKGTAALSAATLAAAEAGYGAARLALMTMKDAEARPLKIVPTILEVPPALENQGKLLLNNPKLADDTPNPFHGTATLEVNPGLTSSTAWFLHCTKRPVKPFVYQERKKPVFVQQTDPQSDNVFKRKKFLFGAEARAAAGYTFWQLSYGSTGTG